MINTRAWDQLLKVMFIVLIAGAMWPASYWFEVDHISVPNAKVGKPIVMEVQRSIHRPFSADWHVVVRRRTTAGSWVITCAADGSTDYLPEASLPQPTTLDWWTNGRCPSLTPGTFRIHTTWQLEPQYVPTKRVTAVSNIFEVTE